MDDEKSQFLDGLQILSKKLSYHNQPNTDILQKEFEEAEKEFKRLKIEDKLLGHEITSTNKIIEDLRLTLKKHSSIDSPTKSSLMKFLFTNPATKQSNRAQLFASEKKELLHSSKADESSLRRRNTSANNDGVIHHEKMQDKIADDMISLTKILKHNISASGEIIKKDIKMLNHITANTDTNLRNLKKENQKLDAEKNKGSCWLCVLIGLVSFIFVFMIFFIRFFPKPRQN